MVSILLLICDPINPMVSNHYTLLSQIPEGTKWLTILKLKGTFFFCIFLHPNIPYSFAFKEPSMQFTQLIWIVLSQGFPESPRLFGRDLSKDLSEFSYPQPTALQNVDDILLVLRQRNITKRHFSTF